MRRRKNLIIAMVFVLLVAAVGVAWTIYDYTKTIKELKDNNKELGSIIEEYENNMMDVYEVISDVKSGAVVESFHIGVVEVPLEAVPANAITDVAQLEGKQFKIDVKANTCLSEDMMIDYVLTDDMRELDLVMDSIPIGLEIGDYVDVRICFPLGEDYIALSQKKVVGIFDNVIKVIVNQQDFYTYESMLTDVAIYNHTKIYAVKYVEAGIQEASQNYYPVGLNALETMLSDPNIDTSDYSKVMDDRYKLEEQLISSDKVEINETVTQSKKDTLQKFTQARENYKKMQLIK